MNRNVPKLRFKGFNDEWIKYKAENLFENISDKNHNGELNVLSVTQDKGVMLRSELDIDIKFDTNSLKSYKKVKDGDFIISLRSFQGGIETSNQVGLISPAYTVFNFNEKNKFNTKFMGYIFKSENFIRKMSGLIYGIRDGKAISFKDFSTMNFKIPSLQEQERIANFLTKVDKIIEKQDEKVKNLEKYKKGMMQKIFSQEIRFKDENGEEYPEWGEKFISEIATLISSKRVYLSDYVSEGIPFYRGKEITELKNNKIPSDILFISNQKYNEMKNKYGVPKKGDLLLTAVGTLGNSWVIEDNNPFYFKDGNLIWFKELKINVKYLDFYINSNLGKKKIIDSAIGSTQKALTIINLNKIKINVPCMDEQKKIVNYLNKVDNINKKENEKLEKLKQLKKGLLQQMFI